jgi:hypothetical protein
MGKPLPLSMLLSLLFKGDPFGGEGEGVGAFCPEENWDINDNTVQGESVSSGRVRYESVECDARSLLGIFAWNGDDGALSHCDRCSDGTKPAMQCTSGEVEITTRNSPMS